MLAGEIDLVTANLPLFPVTEKSILMIQHLSN